MDSVSGYGVQSAKGAGWTKRLVGTAVITAAVAAIQTAGLPQPVTGPAVNAGLFLAANSFGPGSGIIVGILTPVMAWLRGLLPPPLLPMMPFIALGNAVLVLGYVWMRNRFSRKWSMPAAIVAASILKCVALTISAQRFCPLIFGPLPSALVWIWTFPQLATALAGGLLFVLIDRAIGKRI
jgi:uncharacterized membrane protein